MLRPKLELLDTDLVDRIISEGIALLENPGIRVHNQEALEILANANAKVDFQARIACIPETLTRQALKTTPREFALFDLNGNPAVHYAGDKIHFDPGSGGLTIIDSRTERPRLPLTDDFIKSIKLVETLPQVDAQSTAFVCSDVVPEIGDLYRLYLALNYMNKPIMLKRFVKGIEVRDDPIALSLMHKSGHKGDFLILAHTRKWYREEQYLPSEVIDRASYEGWKNRGEKSTFERARDWVEKLIPTYQPSKITETLRQELRAITLRAAQTFGMQSLPPLPQEG